MIGPPPAVLIVAEFWHGATGRGLAQGFRNAGWRADEVDSRVFFPHATGFAARAGSRLVRRAQRAAFNAAILEAAHAHPPKLFVTVKGGGIDVATIDALRAGGARTVNYYPDVEFDHPGMSTAQLARYDVIATTKSFHGGALDALVGRERHALVHHGYSPLVHRPVAPPTEESGFAHEAAYVGNHSAYKEGWLHGLIETLPDLGLVVSGFRWAEAVRGTPLARFVRPAAVGDQYAALVSASRINLALHSGPVRTPGWEDKVSTRTFEIPACGGFMLHIDSDEVRKVFEPGREIAVFDTPETLAGQIRHFLEAPDERRRIAAAGYARAVPAYSLDARARDIIALAEAAA